MSGKPRKKNKTLGWICAIWGGLIVLNGIPRLLSPTQSAYGLGRMRKPSQRSLSCLACGVGLWYLVGRVERLLGVGLLAWAASVVFAVGAGLAARDERRASMRRLPVSIGATLAGFVALMFFGAL